MRDRFGADVTWLPFELHPEYPPEGLPRAALLARIGADGDLRMAERFERAGLLWNPPRDVIPNTQLAQQLTELARDRGLGDALHERLMDAYWAESRDIGDTDVLRELAAEVGVGEPDEAWVDDSFRERVRQSTTQAHSIGVTGVPGFLLDRRLLVLGAQPRELFEQAFEQLRTER